MASDYYAHPTAVVSEEATIGKGTKIWHHAQVRENATIGADCNLGKNVYIDTDVTIGSRVKVQNNCSIYHPAQIGDGVFLGPHVVLTNDRVPRAVLPNGMPKGNDDWSTNGVAIKQGASLGASVTVLPGIIVGEWAMVGAGTVVTRDVPDHGMVFGNPGRLVGYVCKCGLKRTAKMEDLHCECLQTMETE